MYVPAYGGSLPDILLTPTDEQPILAKAGETWIDVRVKTPQDDDCILTIQTVDGGEDAITVNISSESFRIPSLMPGNRYQLFMINSQGNIIGNTSVTTLAAFIDDDLDTSDPYILRNEDGLFVADNDGQIIFSWASWGSKGAAVYEVTINNAGQNIVTLVKDTSVSIQGVSGSLYSVTVIPRDVSGEALGQIESRTIFCSADDVKSVSDVVIQ